MFWNLGFNSKIDRILEQSTISLEELLDEDELLQECKANNSKLVEYLALPETLSQLVEYVTTMPNENDSESRRYKYPYVASEVLCSDVAGMRTALLADGGKQIASLFSVLDQPAPIPPVLAGYVSLILNQTAAPLGCAPLLTETTASSKRFESCVAAVQSSAFVLQGATGCAQGASQSVGGYSIGARLA